MKRTFIKFAATVILLFVMVVSGFAQAGKTLQFVLSDPTHSFTVTIQQPHLATLNSDNPSASMDALYVTTDNKTVVNIQTTSSKSSSGYTVTINTDSKMVYSYNTSTATGYYGEVPLETNSEITHVYISIIKK
jgi:hypothetical protein